MHKHRTSSPIQLFSLSIIFTLGSCGTVGHLITENQLEHIRIGISTTKDVKKILGTPKPSVSSDSSEAQAETWVYTYAKYSGDPHTGVPPIGMTSIPMNRNHSRNNHIHITFNTKGVVTAINGRRQP